MNVINLNITKEISRKLKTKYQKKSGSISIILCKLISCFNGRSKNKNKKKEINEIQCLKVSDNVNSKLVTRASSDNARTSSAVELCIHEKNYNGLSYSRSRDGGVTDNRKRRILSGAYDSQARYRDIRFVWQVHKRVHSYRSKCSRPPGLVEPHGHCTSYNSTPRAYTRIHTDTRVTAHRHALLRCRDREAHR